MDLRQSPMATEPEDSRFSPAPIRARWRELESEAEAEVVIAVARRVPVAIRRAAVPGLVVPAAAAVDPVGAL